MTALSRYALLLLILTTCDLSGCSTFAGNTDIVHLDLAHNTLMAQRWTHEGNGHYRGGHVKQAEAAFEKAIDADPTYGPAHNNLGLLHFDRRELYRAAWSFQRAADLMPDQAEPLNNLGLTYEAAGRLDQAIEMYYSAFGLEGTNPEYLGNLARARIRRGDRDEALQVELRQLLFIDSRPDWVDWAEDQLALVLDKAPRRPADESAGQESRTTRELLPIPSGTGPPGSDQPQPDSPLPDQMELPFGGTQYQIRDR